MNYYLSTEKDLTHSEFKWYKKNKKFPIPGQYLIYTENKDKIKYDIIDVVIYTRDYTMMQEFVKDNKSAIDTNNYDEFFWIRLDDESEITFLILCNNPKIIKGIFGFNLNRI